MNCEDGHPGNEDDSDQILITCLIFLIQTPFITCFIVGEIYKDDIYHTGLDLPGCDDVAGSCPGEDDLIIILQFFMIKIKMLITENLNHLIDLTRFNATSFQEILDHEHNVSDSDIMKYIMKREMMIQRRRVKRNSLAGKKGVMYVNLEGGGGGESCPSLADSAAVSLSQVLLASDWLTYTVIISDWLIRWRSYLCQSPSSQ